MATEREIHWLADYREEDGTLAFRIGRRGDEVIAEWIDTACLVARRDGSASTFEPSPEAAAEEVEKIRRGSAMLLLRHLQGKLALHGAVVELDGRAIALVGRSGQGKSTLAAALCAAGATLLADDAIALDPVDGAFVVQPTEAHHWLDADAREALGQPDARAWEHLWAGKWGTPTRAPAERACRLVALVELAFDPDVAPPTLVRTTGLDALASLVPQTVRFALDDEDRHKAEVAMLFDLLGAVQTYRLGRPRALARLAESVALVHALVRGLD